jgi:hypothetical protein
MTKAEDQGDALLAELTRQTGGDVTELLADPAPPGTEFELTDAQIDELLRELVEPSEIDALLAALERLG